MTVTAARPEAEVVAVAAVPQRPPSASPAAWGVRRWNAAGASARSIAAVLCAGGVVFALVAAAVALTPDGTLTTPWFPAAGAGAGAVMLSSGRRRQGMVVVIALATGAGYLTGGWPTSVAACFALSTVAECLVAGGLLARGDHRQLATVPDLLRLVAVVVMASAVAGIGSALAAWQFTDMSGWSTLGTTVFAHQTGMLVLLPVALRSPRPVASARRPEVVAQSALLLAVTVFIFAPSQRLPLTFLVLVVLMWAGLRLGSRITSVQLLVLGVLATAFTEHGDGPFSQADDIVSAGSATKLLQVFLLTCAILVLALAVSAARREGVLAEISAGKRFLDTLVETMDVGVLAADATGRPSMSNRMLREMQGTSGSPQTFLGAGADSPFTLFRADGVTPLAKDEVPLARVLIDGDIHGVPVVIARHGRPPRNLLVHGRQIRDARGALLGAVTVSHDVTELTEREAELKEALRALADQREFDAAVMEVINAGVVACDAQGNVVLRNATQRRITGVPAVSRRLTDELPVSLHLQTADGSEIPLDRSPLHRALAGETIVDLAMRITPPGLPPADVITSARAIYDGDGRLLGAVSAFTDVTAERAAQAQLRESAAFHDALLAATPDMIYISDAATSKNVWASRNMHSLFGWDEELLRSMGGDAVALLTHPDDLDRVIESRGHARELADGQVQHLRYRIKNGTGQYRWLSRRSTPFVRAPDGTVLQLLGVARDVTDAVEVEDRLTEAALHDPLTGLPNRRLLSDRLATALHRTARVGGEAAVLFCDLDGFKRVNDTAGHAAGDEVLRVTADRLRSVIRPQDTVARVGGDEFVVVIGLVDERPAGPPSRSAPESSPELDGRTDADSPVTDSSPAHPSGAGAADPRHVATFVADRITESLSRPIDVDGTLHVVTVSIGLTFAKSGDLPENVLSDADSAMYKAKLHGRNRLEVFDTVLRADAAQRGRDEVVLRRAVAALGTDVDRGTGLAGPPAAGAALSVAYQPIVDLSTQRVVGVEALARLCDEHGRAITPDVFIPIAEETGLIAALGRFVIDTACTDLAGWHGAAPGRDRLGVSVNLSARQAGRSDLPETVAGALRRTGVDPSLLTLEITESVLLDAGRSAMTVLNTIRDTGVKIDIDDFGTGYASLRYLAELPVTGLKIDRSFVAGLPDHVVSQTIVAAIAALARDLHLTCVAEGIETDAQLRALPAGLTGQGFLLGRPMSRSDIDARLSKDQARAEALGSH